MKLIDSISCCAIALSLVPSLASADEPSPRDWAHRRVEEGLLKPLAAQEDRSFSRSRPAPRERKLRITGAEATRDAKGLSFLTFAVDVRFGSEWRKDDVVGCVYKGTGKLFVKRGDAYRPAEFLLGKDVKPVPGVCKSPAPNT